MTIVRINYCPSCGSELDDGSFICPLCSVDVEELFAKGYLLKSDSEDNSIELFNADEEFIVVDDDSEVEMNSDDEIVIVVPEDRDSDELVIDLDELGIDVESMPREVNIVVQVDGANLEDGFEFDDCDIPHCEWYFDNDPYGIVYYRFINVEDRL